MKWEKASSYTYDIFLSFSFVFLPNDLFAYFSSFNFASMKTTFTKNYTHTFGFKFMGNCDGKYISLSGKF